MVSPIDPRGAFGGCCWLTFSPVGQEVEAGLPSCPVSLPQGYGDTFRDLWLGWGQGSYRRSLGIGAMVQSAIGCGPQGQLLHMLASGRSGDVRLPAPALPQHVTSP